MLTIEQIMTADVVTAAPTTPLVDVMKKMAVSRISCVIVVDKTLAPKGIVTERGIIAKLVGAKKPMREIELKDVMQKDPLCVAPSDEINTIVNLIKARRFRHFPVVYKNKLVGIVTETDLLTGTIKEIKHLNWKLVAGKIDVDSFEKSLKEHGLM